MELALKPKLFHSRLVIEAMCISIVRATQERSPRQPMRHDL
jgi:hypothetical protein